MATYKLDLPGGGFVHFDAPDNASDDQLQAIGQQHFAQHQANLQKTMAQARADYDPTKDLTGTDAVLSNLGAGFANLGQGVKSLYTKATGNAADKAAMDADIREKRAIDEHLAQNTTGGGALQLAGEVLPTLAIPGGGFASAGRAAAGLVGRGAADALAGYRAAEGLTGVAGAAARGLGNVATAPIRGAASVAGDVAGLGSELNSARQAGNLWNVLKQTLKQTRAAQLGQASTTADAALAGGVSGALAPTTSDESTLGRVALGAGLGAAVPFLGQKVASTVSRLNPWGSGESAAARVVGEQLGGTGSSAAERAAAAQRVADQIRALPPRATAGAEAAAGDVAGTAAGDVAGDVGAAAPRFNTPQEYAAFRASGGRPAPARGGGGASGGNYPGGNIPLSTASQLGDENLAWLESRIARAQRRQLGRP